MIKKIFSFLILIFVLFSCWNEVTEDVSTLQKIDKNNFSIEIPSEWSLIENDSKTLPKTKVGNIELVSISSEVVSGFSSNLLILSQDIYKWVKSDEFSIINNVWSTKEYLNYQKLDSKKIDFADKDTSTLYIFEAKYNTKTPVFKYLQVWKVCDKKAYLMTIALSQDVKNTQKYEDILKSFNCK